MDEQHGKVLIVDDDPVLLEALGELVGAWGYVPVLASGPGDAIRIFESDPDIRLIVSDHNMSPLTGIQMIARLRRMDRRFEAIIFSAGRPERLIAAAAVFGIRKIVTKPDYHWLREELAAAAIALDMNP
ncbi:MAG: response regulator [Candidatus Sungbacteria bacterium]|nr:response regulator [Candidatus Sungbacteria bacterium]